MTVPAGRHEVGTLWIKSNVELNLADGAELVGSCRWNDYPLWKPRGTRSQKDIYGWCALLCAEAVTNISITGKGVIDGRGAAFKARTRFPVKTHDLDGRPRNILFASCKRVKIEDVMLKDSAMWTQHYFDCEDVWIENIRVNARVNFNNDGIDIDGCRRVTIRNCRIESADDAIVLKNTAVIPCEDVLVEDCDLATQTSGFKLGTESLAGFRRVTARNLRIRAADNKTDFMHPTWTGRAISALEIISVDGGVVEDVRINDVKAHNVGSPLFIRVGNRSRPVHEELGLGGLPPGRVRGVWIEGLTCTDCGNWGSSVTAFEPSRIEDVVLKDVRVMSLGGVTQGKWLPTKAVKAIEQNYPSPYCFGGNLPAKGLYLLHAGNVIVRDFSILSQQEDVRPVEVRLP